jgi:hypothetical protein
VSSELKTEAKRIRLIDHTICLTSPHLPERDIDWATIHNAVGKADAFMRTSQLGTTTPPLHEDVGAYFADDVVPNALHKEVGSCSLVTYGQMI